MPSSMTAPMGCAEAMLMGMRSKLQPSRCNHDPWLSPMLRFRVVWISAQGETFLPLCGSRPEYYVVGLWESEAALIAARPQMIEHLNAVRHCLEELSPELWVTDPVSGQVVTHKS